MVFNLGVNQVTQENPEALAAGVCAALVVFGSMALHQGWVGLGLLILPIAYVVGGYQSAREGLTTLFVEKELDVDLLMIVAALGAALLGLWRREYHLIVDGAMLILIFAISGALEGYAMKRTDRSIRALMSLTPDTARVLLKGQEVMIPISQLNISDEVLVKPGELIPTDAVIIEGYSTLNQAAITGESLPVEKTVGDEVFAGSLNGYGVLKLRVNQPPESSLIQRVIKLVEQAQSETPPSQQFLETFERGYAKVIVIGGLMLAILPPLVLSWSWETAIYRALIFLVVASPCALMAAIMPTLLSAIANGARQGILFKNGTQLEIMGKVRAIAFDKTGTLTTGNLEVVEVFAGGEMSDYELVSIAGSLEAYSEHPIGQAMARYATTKSNLITNINDIQAHPGEGIKGNVAGIATIIGKPGFIKSYVTDLTADFTEKTEDLEGEGKTVVWVAQQGKVLGLIAVADSIRDEAVEAIASLKKLGVEHIIMLTGDNQRTANTVAASLGITQVYGELLPEDKLAVIKKLQKQYETVAMVGDGINDAPALAQASVGIAMGKAGSDVALETADIVLMGDRLEKLAEAIKLGRRSANVIKQNIVFALGFIVLLLVANFAGNITLPFGVIGHEGSTVLVTLSGLRLLSK